MTRRASRALATGLMGLALLGSGCAGDDEALRSRLTALDGRLAAIEKRLGGLETAVPDAARLRDEIGDVGRRVDALTTRVTQLAATPPPAAPVPGSGAAAGTAPGAGTTAGMTAEAEAARRRAMAVQELGVEYREKLADLNRQRDEGATPKQLADQRRELSRWFRDRRKELLFGDTAPVPGSPAAGAGGPPPAAGVQ